MVLEREGELFKTDSSSIVEWLQKSGQLKIEGKKKNYFKRNDKRRKKILID